MDKEKTLLDLHPAICEKAVNLYFDGVPLKEAIEQAIKEYEGVL